MIQSEERRKCREAQIASPVINGNFSLVRKLKLCQLNTTHNTSNCQTDNSLLPSTPQSLKKQRKNISLQKHLRCYNITAHRECLPVADNDRPGLIFKRYFSMMAIKVYVSAYTPPGKLGAAVPFKLLQAVFCEGLQPYNVGLQ